MKTRNLMMTAAAAIVMTGAAIAQTPMTASVPFGFQFGDTNLPAGEYRVDTSRVLADGLVVIQNAETKQVVARIGVSGYWSQSSDSRPRLVFGCGETVCVLNQVWSPASKSEFALPKGANPQYTAAVLLAPSRAD